MDSYKRPYRGTKIYVRKKDKNDNELVKLYKKSEFSEEAKEDIDDFLDESNEIDEEDVPVKKSVKKQRKKEQEKAEKRTRAKSALGKIVASILAVAALVFRFSQSPHWYFVDQSFSSHILPKILPNNRK